MIPAYTAGPVTLGQSRLTAGPHTGGRDLLAEISGQADPHTPELGPLIVVNPREFGPTGWGDWNEQQFQSGHTNNLVTNPSSEQGFGVGPERKWGHYPSPDNPNPFRLSNTLFRNGGDTYSTMVYRPEIRSYWAMSQQQELGTHKYQARSGVVEQPASVPYVETVPPINPGGY